MFSLFTVAVSPLKEKLQVENTEESARALDEKINIENGII